MSALPPQVASRVSILAADVQEAFPLAMSGLYLHGSAAFGGWHPARSDIDLLLVTMRPLTAAEKHGFTRSLQAKPWPGNGVEASVVVAAPDMTLPRAPPFELHLTTGEGAKVVDGAGHPGDSDLVMHYAVCRERGVAVFGPPPAEAFPAVSRRMLLNALFDEVLWGFEHAPPAYAVLNACRAWAYAVDGCLLSKIEGAEWALQHGIEPGTVRPALEVQRGLADAPESLAVDAGVERIVAQARTILFARALSDA